VKSYWWPGQSVVHCSHSQWFWSTTFHPKPTSVKIIIILLCIVIWCCFTGSVFCGWRGQKCYWWFKLPWQSSAYQKPFLYSILVTRWGRTYTLRITHMHTHSELLTCIHTQNYSHAYTLRFTHRFTHMHTHSELLTCIHTQNYSHAYTLRFTHMHTHSELLTCIHTQNYSHAYTLKIISSYPANNWVHPRYITDLNIFTCLAP